MRPYVGSASGALVPDLSAVLYVRRDPMHPSSFRLAWSHPDSDSYCMAEGECSAVYHRTERAAIAYGERAYGETAKRWPRHWA